jgi:chromosome segregation protein
LGFGVITNHNKFDLNEFRQLRKKARQSGVGLLPGIELSIKDGQAGVHTLVVFSDEWIINKEHENWIQSFLGVTFAGQSNFENENARSNHDILETIRELDKFHKDYFLVFAHVEAPNGLWGGLSIGRVDELFQNKDFKRRALGFQKVRTHDLKAKFVQALGSQYPAELEGSDAKNMADIGSRKKQSFLKLGSSSFDAVKFALQSNVDRVKSSKPQTTHAHLKSITFEGAGALGGTTVDLSAQLNTFIGIRGSGKSSVLEGIRYALNIPFGDKASDTDYKNGLVKHLLSSGGKVTLEAIDRRGQPYQISRILDEKPDVYANGQIQPGVSIGETVIYKPIYFGQKDLSSTGAGFEKDLIEKLLGETLIPIRQKIAEQQQAVIDVIRKMSQLKRATEQKKEWQDKKEDAQFRLAFYKKHGAEEKLQKQVNFERDEGKARQIIQQTQQFFDGLNEFTALNEDELNNQLKYSSVENAEFFAGFFEIYQQVIKGFTSLKNFSEQGPAVMAQLQAKLTEFEQLKAALKQDFAQIERTLAGELQQAGAVAISPKEFKQLKISLDHAQRMLNELAGSETKQDKMTEQLVEALACLDLLYRQEFSIVEQKLQSINRQDSPLQVTAKYQSNKKTMLTYMQNIFHGSRIRENTLNGLVKHYQNFGDM